MYSLSIVIVNGSIDVAESDNVQISKHDAKLALFLLEHFPSVVTRGEADLLCDKVLDSQLYGDEVNGGCIIFCATILIFPRGCIVQIIYQAWIEVALALAAG